MDENNNMTDKQSGTSSNDLQSQTGLSSNDLQSQTGLSSADSGSQTNDSDGALHDQADLTNQNTQNRTEPEVFKSAFSTDPTFNQSGSAPHIDAVYTMDPGTYTNSYSSAPESPESASNGYAIASLILGILSIPGGCCCGMGALLSVIGIILGCIQPKNSLGQKPGMAIAGIVLSSIGILISICSIIYVVCVGAALPSVNSYF